MKKVKNTVLMITHIHRRPRHGPYRAKLVCTKQNMFYFYSQKHTPSYNDA